MVEKIIVNPSEVRGLGDILEVKSTSDFTLYGATLSSGTDTVYGASSSVFVLNSTNSHDYSLSFGSASYTATGGSCTVTVTLTDDSTPVENATISVTGGTGGSGSGTTNSSGVASINVTGITASGNLTASFSGVTATASVTYVSYLFYDDCSVDNTSQYSTNVRIGSVTNNATLTFDSTETAYYTTITTTQDSWYGWVIPNTRGEDNIKITCNVKLASNSAYNQFIIGCADNIAQSSSSGTIDQYRIRADNKADYLHNSGNEVSGSSKTTSVQNVYVYVVFEKSGNTITGSTYNSSNTLLSTYTYSNANSYTNPYFYMLINTNQSANHSYIKNIKVESL